MSLNYQDGMPPRGGEEMDDPESEEIQPEEIEV